MKTKLRNLFNKLFKREPKEQTVKPLDIEQRATADNIHLLCSLLISEFKGRYENHTYYPPPIVKFPFIMDDIEEAIRIIDESSRTIRKKEMLTIKDLDVPVTHKSFNQYFVSKNNTYYPINSSLKTFVDLLDSFFTLCLSDPDALSGYYPNIRFATTPLAFKIRKLLIAILKEQ